MKNSITTFLILFFFSAFSSLCNAQFNELYSNLGGDKSLRFNIHNTVKPGKQYRFISREISSYGVLDLEIMNSSWERSVRFGSTHTIFDNPVAIGGNISTGSMLSVKGRIHAEEVKVDLTVPADYVFEYYYDGFSNLKPDYKLKSLSEIEDFIKVYKHLPEIPSAKEIQENGLHLKEMTNLLLQKIEELTIYLIEQDKRIKELEDNLTKQ